MSIRIGATEGQPHNFVWTSQEVLGQYKDLVLISNCGKQHTVNLCAFLAVTGLHDVIRLSISDFSDTLYITSEYTDNELSEFVHFVSTGEVFKSPEQLNWLEFVRYELKIEDFVPCTPSSKPVVQNEVFEEIKIEPELVKNEKYERKTTELPELTPLTKTYQDDVLDPLGVNSDSDMDFIACNSDESDLDDSFDDDDFDITGNKRKKRKKTKPVKIEKNAMRKKKLKSKNDPNQTFPCKFCDKVLKTRSFYERHLDRVHPDGKGDPTDKYVRPSDRPAMCSLCGRVLCSTFVLRQHIERVHSEERRPKVPLPKTIKCDLCSLMFATEERLKIHRVNHFKERSFLCNVCGKGFKFQHLLNTHLKTVHIESKPFKCEICGKSFAIEIRLKQHLLSHDDSREYRCEKCNKKFKSPMGLKTHTDFVHNNIHVNVPNVPKLLLQTPLCWFTWTVHMEKCIHAHTVTKRSWGKRT